MECNRQTCTATHDENIEVVVADIEKWSGTAVRLWEAIEVSCTNFVDHCNLIVLSMNFKMIKMDL